MLTPGLAFADRNLYLADADVTPVPVAGLIEDSYLTLRAQLVDRDRANPAPRAGNPRWRQVTLAPQPEQPEHGTSHLSVIDAAGASESVSVRLQ